MLDPDDEVHQPTIYRLKKGLKERELRQSRLVLFKRVAAAMLAFILVGGAIALYLIDYQRKEAKSAQLLAEKNEGIAKEQTLIAKEQTRQAKENLDRAIAGEKEAKAQKSIADANAIEAQENAIEAQNNAMLAAEKAQEALDQKKIAELNEQLAIKNKEAAEASADEAERQAGIAETQRKIAVRNAEEALAQKQKAEYEVYLSQIGLAKARIERNEFDDARRILDSLKASRGTSNLGWEWRWLARQARQSRLADKTNAAALDLAITGSGTSGAVVLEDGSIEVLSLDSTGNVTQQRSFRLPDQAEASAVAYSGDQQFVAIGTMAGEIQIWDQAVKRRMASLVGHENRVTDLTFAPSGELISGSMDRTARIWNIAAGKQLAACWHIAPVQQVAVAKRGSLTTSRDSSRGQFDGPCGCLAFVRFRNGNESGTNRRVSGACWSRFVACDCTKRGHGRYGRRCWQHFYLAGG